MKKDKTKVRKKQKLLQDKLTDACNFYMRLENKTETGRKLVLDNIIPLATVYQIPLTKDSSFTADFSRSVRDLKDNSKGYQFILLQLYNSLLE